MLLCLCGEYGLRTLYTFMIWGSSPHMRGIHDGLIGWAKLPGFIPAHAGNTKAMLIISLVFGVRPRSRGEYYFRWSKCQ